MVSRANDMDPDHLTDTDSMSSREPCVSVVVNSWTLAVWEMNVSRSSIIIATNKNVNTLGTSLRGVRRRVVPFRESQIDHRK